MDEEELLQNLARELILSAHRMGVKVVLVALAAQREDGTLASMSGTVLEDKDYKTAMHLMADDDDEVPWQQGI